MARLPLGSRRTAIAVAVVAALALLVSACGEGGSAEPAPSPAASKSPRPPQPSSEPIAGGPLVPVVRVVDGDTIWVPPQERVRLIGIDTPEVDWYGGEAECYGEEAGLFLRRLLEDERVRLEYDEELVDPYGRTLAYVYLEDGRMVNLVLVRQGFAVVTIFEPNDRHRARLHSAEREARSAGRGLWSAC